MLNHEPRAPVEILVTGVRDMRQLENFAMRRCPREAERIPGTAPADAMRAIGAHAEGALVALVAACASDGLKVWQSDYPAQPWLSSLRERVVDLWHDHEHSYRTTLLLLGHGIERMHLVASSASATSKVALTEFCSAWLATRSSLLQRARAELSWFARNPEKGADQRWLRERYGRPERGPALHPLARETGRKGASNVGEDETSGSE